MNRLAKMMQAAGVGANEAVLIHKPSNIFYLSGYTGEGLWPRARASRPS